MIAGGSQKTNLGGVNSYVAKAPDYALVYTKGLYALTFHVQSDADTTLLIKLPDGKWIANDDGGKGTNPLIRIPSPVSGRYEIWVGTYGNKPAPATLHITELNVDTKTAPPATGLASANEKSTVYKDVIKQIQNIKSTPSDERINGTYSTKHLFDTYTAGTHHPQGIAQLRRCKTINYRIVR